MPFEFTCPYCFKKTVVDEQFVGQQGACVGCGKPITIPQPKRIANPIVRPVHSKHLETGPTQVTVEFRRLVQRVVTITLSICAICGITYWIFWPSLLSLRIRRDSVACMNNLQRIAQALNEYAVDYGTYPPPVINDSTGKPMHSWRVLILPYLGENNLYARYNFDQPWDSADNAQLIAECPQVFISPKARNTLAAAESNYVLVTGSGTVFPPSGPLAPSQIADGAANTLLVVEIRNRQFQWSQPFDIDFAKLNTTSGALGTNAIGGNHPGGATAVLADGRAIWIPGDISPALLRSIITAGGQEPINATWFQGN